MMSSVHPLTSVSELAAALDSAAPPALLDVRWKIGGPPGIDSYRAGHVPGAVFVDLDSALAGPPGAGGRHPLPETADFEAAMRAAGVHADQRVVVCDESDGTIAARAWWLLRYHGHRQVQVLDGGFRAWQAAGMPVSTLDASPEAAGDFTARPGHMPMVDAAGAAELAASGILLDARAPARYRGETEPIDPVAGHIPGALSAPTAENVTASGQFKSAEELRDRFGALGVEFGADSGESGGGHGHSGEAGGRPVGAYCGSGVTAAHEVLALELAGSPAALYVGSWSGWIADRDRPVATGPQPTKVG
jgi:thiosulfate/3-mercaptopyruvate sulfurtransferase